MKLSATHLDSWQRHGYVVIEDFVDSITLTHAQESLHQILPTWEQWRDQRHLWPDARELTVLHFPFGKSPLDDIVFDPDLIAFAQTALGTQEIVVSHSEILSKYVSDVDFGQPMHLGYTDNTLVVPPSDQHEQLASIIYYTDITAGMGPTCVVSVCNSKSFSNETCVTRDVQGAQQLYGAEVPLTVKAGSILLYTMRTFHRGSSLLATAGVRLTHHVSYQRAGTTWGGWRSFAKLGDTRGMAELLTRLSPHERSMIGFPSPSDAYWTAETIAGVARRYPMMDMSPYVS